MFRCFFRFSSGSIICFAGFPGFAKKYCGKQFLQFQANVPGLAFTTPAPDTRTPLDQPLCATR
jgi:hypothetical protein